MLSNNSARTFSKYNTPGLPSQKFQMLGINRDEKLHILPDAAVTPYALMTACVEKGQDMLKTS